jgi:hypothetical protein
MKFGKELSIHAMEDVHGHFVEVQRTGGARAISWHM